MLVSRRQNDVGDCAQQVASLESELSTRMQKLHSTVQSKNAVPTAQVYVSIRHIAHVASWLSVLLCFK